MLGWCEGCLVRCWHRAAGLGRDRDVGKEQRSGTKPRLAGPSRNLCRWLGTVPRRGLGLGHEHLGWQQRGLSSVHSHTLSVVTPSTHGCPRLGGVHGEQLGAAKSRDTSGCLCEPGCWRRGLLAPQPWAGLMSTGG